MLAVRADLSSVSHPSNINLPINSPANKSDAGMENQLLKSPIV